MELCAEASKLSANSSGDFGIVREGAESIDAEGFDG
jgi:hypothetical protein